MQSTINRLHGKLLEVRTNQPYTATKYADLHCTQATELKTWLFGKSFPPQTFSLPTGLIVRTLCPFNVFILLNGWICLYSVLD